MSELKQKFESQTSNNVLFSYDADEILSAYTSMFEKSIERHAKEHSDAVTLFRSDYMRHNAKPKEYKTLDNAERKAYNEMVISYNKIRQAAARRAALNFQSDPENNPYNLKTAYELFKMAGLTGENIEDALDLIHQNLTGTAHPTPDLNQRYPNLDLKTPEGVLEIGKYIASSGENNKPAQLDKYATAVDKLLYLVDSETLEDAKYAIDQMMDLNMAPTERLNTFEELIHGLAAAVRGSSAISGVLEDIRTFSHEVYNVTQPTHPVNPLHPDFGLIAEESIWNDADGKRNSDHVRMLAYDVLNLFVASLVHLDNLDEIKKLHQAIESNNTYTDLQHAFSTVRDRLTPLLVDVADLFDTLHDKSLSTEQRGELYHKNEEQFEKLHIKAGKVLDDIKFDGRTLGKFGVDLFKAAESSFNTLVGILEEKEGQEFAYKSAGKIHKNGLGITKSECRTNVNVVNETGNNIFQNKGFIQYLKQGGFLSEDLLSQIEGLDDQCITTLPFKTLEHIFSEITRNTPHQKRLQFLKESNPLELHPDDGFPKQNYALVLRLGVTGKFGLLHGPFITAEADEKSSLMMRFLMDCFGNKLSAVPVMGLYEDSETITKSVETFENNRERMRTGFINRLRQNNLVKTLREKIMWARSDTTKGMGAKAPMMVAEGVVGLTRRSLDIWWNDGKMDGEILPILHKFGCGLATQRGGGAPMVTPRLIAQTIQAFTRENNIPPKDIPDDLLRMALNVDYTVQGRGTYRNVAEIKHEREQQIAEFLLIYLELKGVVKEGTAIPQTKPFSENMSRFLKESIAKDTYTYSAGRAAKAKQGDSKIVLDSLMKKTCSNDVLAWANVGARPPSKSGGKGYTKQRAIGTTKRAAAQGGHHDAFFGEGRFMRTLHEALHKGYELENGETIQLTGQDIKDFKENGLWDYELTKRIVMEISQTDFTYAFEQLGMNDWDSDKLYKVARETRFVNGEESDKPILEYPNDVEPEQALQALQYADFRAYVRGLNALNDSSFLNNPDLYDANPKGLTPTADFNAAVMNNTDYAFIQEIRDETKITRRTLGVVREENQLIIDGKSDDITAISAALGFTGGYNIQKEILSWVSGYKKAFGQRLKPITDLKACLTPEYGGSADNDNRPGLVGSVYLEFTA